LRICCTFTTEATVPGGFEGSGIWKIAQCLLGSNFSFIGSNFSTPNFLRTCSDFRALLHKIEIKENIGWKKCSCKG